MFNDVRVVRRKHRRVIISKVIEKSLIIILKCPCNVFDIVPIYIYLQQ